MKQLDGRELDDLEDIDIQPIDLSMPVMKEVSARWLVDMAEHISDKFKLIVSKFLRLGITRAFEEENDSGMNQVRKTLAVMKNTRS